jgi:predicted phage tail protein
MVTIRLLGEAGRRFGRKFTLDVKNAAEAVRALCVQMPAMRQYLVDSSDNGINWRVVTEDPMGLDEEGLLSPCSKRVVLAPQPAGRGSVGRIILGVALIAGAFIIGQPWLGKFAFNLFVGVGTSLVLGGIAQLLTPTPQTTGSRSNEEQRNSFTFDKSNVNTAQGSVVPVLYGERIVGSLPVISFSIELQNSL